MMSLSGSKAIFLSAKSTMSGFVCWKWELWTSQTAMHKLGRQERRFRWKHGVKIKWVNNWWLSNYYNTTPRIHWIPIKIAHCKRPKRETESTYFTALHFLSFTVRALSSLKMEYMTLQRWSPTHLPPKVLQSSPDKCFAQVASSETAVTSATETTQIF